jgi:GNAT superfamily N-acetyltransferase
MIDVRRMRISDIAAGMRLKTLAGWNQVEADWRLFLALNPDGCFVAAHDGTVVGTVTTATYGAALSWIGMLLVDPAYRRRGIGTLLMRTAIASTGDCPAIGLDATPAGRRLYERLGFRGQYGLRRMTIDRFPPLTVQPPDVRSCSPITGSSIDPVAALERSVLGADRSPLLRALRDRTPGMAWQIVHQRQARGFCLGRAGTHLIQIGPLIAETSGEAIALCTAAMGGMAGQAVALDVPEIREDFLRWLCALGFGEQRPFTRMVLARSAAASGGFGPPAQQYAIVGPEFG